MTLIEAFDACFREYRKDGVEVDEPLERACMLGVGMCAAIGILDEVESAADIFYLSWHMTYANLTVDIPAEDLVLRDLPDFLWERAWDYEELLIEELRAAKRTTLADRLASEHRKSLAEVDA